MPPMTRIIKLAQGCRNELNLPATGRAFIALSVPLGYYLLTGDPLALKIAMITVSLLVVAERLGPSLPLMLAQAMLIVLATGIVFTAYPIPLLYMVVCAALAYGSIAIMYAGEQWKVFGTFVLVPGLYIGSELRSIPPPSTMPSPFHHWLQLLPWAVLPPLAIVVAQAIWPSASHGPKAGPRLKTFTPPSCHWLASEPLRIRLIASMSLARSMGAGLAALWVATMHIDFGGWLIWSTSSVIAGDWKRCQERWADRTRGLLVGLPIGIGAAALAPKNEAVFLCSILGIYLSLIAMRTYRHAYTARCILLMVSASGINQIKDTALWRAENVAVGGAIGITLAFLTYRLRNTG